MVLSNLLRRNILFLFSSLNMCVFAQETPAQDNNNLEYATGLYKQGRQSFDEGKYMKADSLYKQALEIRERKAGKRSAEYTESLYAIGELASETFDFPKAIECLTEVEVIRKKKPGTKSSEYAQALNKLGCAYVFSGKVEEGKKLLDKANEILIGRKETKTLLYAEVLRNIGAFYFNMKKFEEADKYYRQAIQISAEVSGKQSIPYARNIIALAGTLLNQWQKEEMEELLAEAASIYQENNLPKHPDMIYIYNNQAYKYMLGGEYAIAEQAWIDIQEIAVQAYSRYSYHYIDALKNLSAAYVLQGHRGKAEPLMLESLELRIVKFGEESQQTVDQLVDFGHYYTMMGNYEQGEAFYIRAQKIAEKHSYWEFYRRTLYGQGHIAARQKDSAKAIDFYQKALKLAQEYGSRADQVQILNFITQTLANTSYNKPLDNEFISLIEESGKLFGAGSISVLRSLLNYGNHLFRNERYADSKEKYNQVLKIMEEKQDVAHLYEIRAATLAGLAEVSLKEKEFFKARNYSFRILQAIRSEAEQSFSFLPENEREAFWNARKTYINYLRKKPYELRTENQRWGEMAYDNELLAKNLLLFSSVRVRNAVAQSGDEELTALWDKLKEERLLQAVGKQTTLNESDMLNLEKQIVRQSDKYADIKTGYRVSWKEVQKHLRPHQAAIEFVCFEDKTDEIYYALLLMPGEEPPLLIPCCRKTELSAAIEKYPAQSVLIHSLVWQPIAKRLATKTTEIFLAPAGLLHLVSFPTLSDSAGNYVFKKIHIRNLMSTRDIIPLATKGHSFIKPGMAVLFGGIDSDISGFDYLPGTEEEVQVAGDVLDKGGWTTVVNTGNMATKNRFRNCISPISPTLLHISTHGYYNQPSGATTSPGAMNPLTRAGLIFTGVNDVLTAQEVSNLNFTGTQLVVLSACYTGLGSIDNSEGVYGFQRAFRLAGAGSMVITLWNIPDSDTVLFMTEFYRRLTNNIPVWEAFSEARKVLRKKYPHDISKWGGFVLIE